MTFASTSNTGIITQTTTTSSNKEQAGSIAYMAPEAIIEGKITAKGDVWSFGVVSIDLLLS